MALIKDDKYTRVMDQSHYIPSKSSPVSGHYGVSLQLGLFGYPGIQNARMINHGIKAESAPISFGKIRISRSFS